MPRFVRIDTSHLVARQHPSRRARVLPIFLLLVLVVSTLVLIALSHVAVVHRANLAQQMLAFPSGAVAAGQAAAAAQTAAGTATGHYRYHHHTARSQPVPAIHVAARAMKPAAVLATARPFRLEPLLSRNVTSVERFSVQLRQAENQLRVQKIMRQAARAHVRPADDVTVVDSATERTSGARFKLQQQQHVLTRTENNNGTWPAFDDEFASSSEVNDSAIADSTGSGHCQVVTGATLLPYCPKVPPYLAGQLFASNHSHVDVKGLAASARANGEVCSGGHWQPPNCTSAHRVAIVIPFRDRQQHLSVLLAHLHPILQRQNLNYRIYVAEQSGNRTFNKGILMNAAFTLAIREGSYHCFVFHDVDLIPEDDRNLYSCPEQPRHMSVAVDEFQYKLPYNLLVGGVFSIRTEHFLKVNGYSNMYWGWGGEDDDMSARIVKSGLQIVRPSIDIARYRMIKHQKRKPLVWKVRGKLLATASKRMRFDGLNTVNFTLISRIEYPLYTNLLVDVGICPFTADLL